ncbi:MAG: DUF1269 domain-containing protein [Carnobacterium sp.]|uniref:DUF1269 domain-containing protein n=1 Tax=Carnobacterium sp. TaxID=48221 RepID=UPI003C721D01
MSRKVIIMKFDEESKAYQAFSEIKKLQTQGEVKGEQMAVLKHLPNHQLTPKDFIDFTGEDNNIKGSLIGMLIGILAGPLGVLLGWFTGSLIGSTKDVKEVKAALSIFEETLKNIPEDETGVILIADEEVTGPIDDLVYGELKGEVVRIDRDAVESELLEAEETEKDAANHAKKRWFK